MHIPGPTPPRPRPLAIPPSVPLPIVVAAEQSTTSLLLTSQVDDSARVLRLLEQRKRYQAVEFVFSLIRPVGTGIGINRLCYKADFYIKPVCLQRIMSMTTQICHCSARDRF